MESTGWGFDQRPTKYCIFIQYLVFFAFMIRHIERSRRQVENRVVAQSAGVRPTDHRQTEQREQTWPPRGAYTLPLFAELAEPPATARSVGYDERPRIDAHLAAAGRLAKKIRRLPDHSAEQTRAGQAICRHLIALLEEGAPENHGDRSEGCRVDPSSLE